MLSKKYLSRFNYQRKQYRHPFGLALVPHVDEVFGILKDLLLARATCCRFLLGSLRAGILHFALVEAYGSGIMDQGNGRIKVGRMHVPISSCA